MSYYKYILTLLVCIAALPALPGNEILFSGFEDSESECALEYYGFSENDIVEVQDCWYGVINPVDGTGGKRYLYVKTDADGRGFERQVRIRGLALKENTSYRVAYYVKSTPQSETSPLLWSMSRGAGTKLSSGSGRFYDYCICNSDSNTAWVRHTAMFHYLNDEVQMYHSGTPGDGFMVSLALNTPNAEYSVDNISVTESNIAGVYYSGDMLRVDFGFDNDVSTVARLASGNGVVLNPGCVTVRIGDRQISLSSVELHSDGYMYIWSQDENFDYADGDVKVSFRNPRDTEFAIHYTSELRPGTQTTGPTFVEDFTDEVALPDEPWMHYADIIPVIYEAPALVYSLPDEGSFNLTDADCEFTFCIDRPVAEPEKASACLTNGMYSERLALGHISADGRTLVFERTGSKVLQGECIINVDGILSVSDGVPASFRVSVSYGEQPMDGPVTCFSTDFDSQKTGTVAKGFHVRDANGDFSNGAASSGSRLMAFTPDSDIPIAMYWGPRTLSEGGSLYCGDDLSGTRLRLKPGRYTVSFPAIGWETNSHIVQFSVYRKDDPSDVLLSESYMPANSAMRGEYFTGADQISYSFTVNDEADYVLLWFVANDDDGGGWGSSAIGNVTLVSEESDARKYWNLLNDALEEALAVYSRYADIPKYVSTELEELGERIEYYQDWRSTSPAAYRQAVGELESCSVSLTERAALVDAFESDYKTAKRVVMRGVATEWAASRLLKQLAEVVDRLEGYDVTAVGTVVLRRDYDSLAEALSALLRRMSDSESLLQTLENTRKYLETNNIYSRLPEYIALSEVCRECDALDYYNCTDQELYGLTDRINGLIAAIEGMKKASSELTRQIRSLEKMAGLLDIDFSQYGLDAEEMAAQSNSCLTDDQTLASLLEMAISVKCCELLSEGGVLPFTDMTCFIQNSQLYTGVMRVNGEAVVINANTEDPYPGWNFEWLGGNVYPGVSWDAVYADDSSPVVDSRIGLDWGAQIMLSQEIGYLPAGVYDLCLGCGMPDAVDSYIRVTQNVNGIETVQDVPVTKGGDQGSWSSQIITLSDFKAYGGPLRVEVYLNSGSSWSSIDNFSLVFKEPLKDAGYAKAASDLKDYMRYYWNETLPVDYIVTTEDECVRYDISGRKMSDSATGIGLEVHKMSDGTVSVRKVFMNK